jgi:hypothetical protein
MTFLWAFFMGFYNQYKILCLSTLILLYCDGGTVDGLVEAISAPSGVAAKNTAAASSVRTAAASLGPACRCARSRRHRSFHLSSGCASVRNYAGSGSGSTVTTVSAAPAVMLPLPPAAAPAAAAATLASSAVLLPLSVAAALALLSVACTPCSFAVAWGRGAWHVLLPAQSSQ